MFRLTLDSVHEWNRQQIYLGFEASASAIREAFPDAEINGCYCHSKLYKKRTDSTFNQCVLL